MKKFLKIFGWILLIAFIGIQFFRPAKNLQEEIAANHISAKFPVPDDVKSILEKGCYDCHSNTSSYPWYFNIQPVGIWMNKHIVDGKKELNFSEYADKKPRFQYRKMEEVIKQVKEGEMPLNSYTWMHGGAKLTTDEKNKLLDWAKSIMDTLEAHYPIDSLKRKGPPPPQK